MIDDKTTELLKKIKALADEGVGGEKDNAQAQLDKLLKKYGITVQDLEDNAEHERRFTYKTEEYKYFVWQILGSVLGSVEMEKRGVFKVGTNKIAIDLTETELIEIKEKLDFFWFKYKQAKEVFKHAFFLKNNLLSDAGGDYDPTPEQREKAKKAAQLAKGLEAEEFRKSLNA